MKQSSLFGLNWLDLFKALVMAFLTGAVAIIGQSTQAGVFELPTQAQLILALKAGIGAMIAYLIKNFFTPAPVVDAVKP